MTNPHGKATEVALVTLASSGNTWAIMFAHLSLWQLLGRLGKLRYPEPTSGPQEPPGQGTFVHRTNGLKMSIFSL
jgi:hypothetical protein